MVRDLTLVPARVLLPDVHDLERPHVVALLVERGEAGVGGVAGLADREDAEVADADPRNLKKKRTNYTDGQHFVSFDEARSRPKNHVQSDIYKVALISSRTLIDISRYHFDLEFLVGIALLEVFWKYELSDQQIGPPSRKVEPPHITI